MTSNNKLIQSGTGRSSPDVIRSDDSKREYIMKHEIRAGKGLDAVRSVNLTSDKRYLIITYESAVPRIRVADLEKLEFLSHNYEGHTASVRLTSLTSDDKAFHTASWDATSRRFEIETGITSHLLSGFGRSPSCYLHPDQEHLFIASYDADCYIDAKNNGRCINLSSRGVVKLYKHTQDRIDPEAVDIVYDDGKVYTGSDDGIAYQWDLSGRNPEIRYFVFEGTVRKLAVSRKYLAAACTDGLVRVHHKISGEYYRHFFHGEKDVREVRISRDEKRLWSATEGGIIRCFNLVTGEEIYHKKVHPLWIWSICLSKDENILVTGSGDGTVAFLNANTGRLLARLYNLTGNKDFLITCPPDTAFPKGFFYAANTSVINVYRYREDGIKEYLGREDPHRAAYINKLNLKNLIISRIKNDNQYSTLTQRYMQSGQLIDQIREKELPKRLKS